MFRSHRAVGRAKPPARHFDVAQVLRGVPAVSSPRRATAHRSMRFVSILVSAFCPPYGSDSSKQRPPPDAALGGHLRRPRAVRARGTEEMQVLFSAERVGQSTLGQLYVGIADGLIAPDRSFQRAS